MASSVSSVAGLRLCGVLMTSPGTGSAVLAPIRRVLSLTSDQSRTGIRAHLMGLSCQGRYGGVGEGPLTGEEVGGSARQWAGGASEMGRGPSGVIRTCWIQEALC
jgi:hypothetical protein